MFHCSGWTYIWVVTAAGGTHVCLRRVEPALIFPASRLPPGDPHVRRPDRHDHADPCRRGGPSTLCAWQADWAGLDLKARAEKMARQGVRIISGGENISSLEVEEVLYSHPAVTEAAVVARPDEKWGEVPCAFVTLKPGAPPVGGEDLIQWSRDRLARFKGRSTSGRSGRRERAAAAVQAAQRPAGERPRFRGDRTGALPRPCKCLSIASSPST